MRRRDVLKLGGATGGLIATAGCIGWLPGGGGGSDSDDEDGDDEEEPTEDGGGGEQEAENNSEANESENETDEDPEAGNETNESNENETAENETDEDRVPDENETEPDRDQYEQQEEREIVELPADTVNVELQADQVPESESSPGGLRIYGSVTNVSEQYVDTVDLDCSIYDTNDEYVGAATLSVGGLEPGEDADVDRSISAYDLQGKPDTLEYDTLVYGPE